MILNLFTLTLVWAQPIPAPKPNYCFGFLKAVPNRPTLSKEETDRIQAAHLAHLKALGEKRWLRAAGPIATPGPIRGILISACKSVEEANELASADPAVKGGRLAVESYSWVGPEGIADRYWKERESNPNAPDKMTKHALLIMHNTGEWKMTPALFEKHHAYIAPARKSGKLAAAGPFFNSPAILGVYVLRDTTLDEARKFAEADPLFQHGARVEALEWWVAENVLP